MHVYSTGQWVLLFFFYCLCGWVWESCYVSLRQRRWVNRGFLQGPLLPIYGSGAILILFVTLPVADDLLLVYLFGTAAATALEYVTGAVMEKMFKVRYWDYSNQRFNLNGYICLTSSIAWGFFSIVLVRFLHPPVARLLAGVPAWFVDPLALGLTAAFTVDVVRSVQAAMDLREIITRLTQENEELRRLARRAEIAAAFAEDDLKKFRERTEVESLLLRARIESELQEQRQELTARTRRWQEQAEAALRRRTEAKLEALDNIAEVLEKARDRMDGVQDLTQEAREELDEAVQGLRHWQERIRSRSETGYRRSLRLLRGNPTARAKDFAEALESLRKLGSGKD